MLLLILRSLIYSFNFHHFQLEDKIESNRLTAHYYIHKIKPANFCENIGSVKIRKLLKIMPKTKKDEDSSSDSGPEDVSHRENEESHLNYDIISENSISLQKKTFREILHQRKLN